MTMAQKCNSCSPIALKWLLIIRQCAVAAINHTACILAIFSPQVPKFRTPSYEKNKTCLFSELQTLGNNGMIRILLSIDWFFRIRLLDYLSRVWLAAGSKCLSAVAEKIDEILQHSDQLISNISIQGTYLHNFQEEGILLYSELVEGKRNEVDGRW